MEERDFDFLLSRAPELKQKHGGKTADKKFKQPRGHISVISQLITHQIYKHHPDHQQC